MHPGLRSRNTLQWHWALLKGLLSRTVHEGRALLYQREALTHHVRCHQIRGEPAMQNPFRRNSALVGNLYGPPSREVVSAVEYLPPARRLGRRRGLDVPPAAALPSAPRAGRPQSPAGVPSAPRPRHLLSQILRGPDLLLPICKMGPLGAGKP